jgi:protein-disulfide isomerase
MKISRRPILAVVLMASLALAACHKAVAPVTADEMSLGDPKAKVTVVEYASVACPFCARFNNEAFPAFKAKYVDTGKVHYVFREMLVGDSNEASMGAAGFLLARCAGKDDYFKVVDQIFHAQEGIYRSGDLRGGLLAIAKANGMSDQQFADCVGDAGSLAAINARSDKAVKDGVDSTPTFFINGKKAFDGVPTEQQLEAAVRAAS